MNNILRSLIGLVALFNLCLGIGFLLFPAPMAVLFFLSADGAQGLATLRADFSSFFLMASSLAFYGAWRERAAPLLVALGLFAIALTGRVIGLVMDGATSTAFTPMIVEVVMISLLLLGALRFRAPSAIT